MKRSRQTGLILLLLMALLPLLPVTASADFGPKPSVVVEVEGMEGQVYYVTLLSQDESTGPWSKQETAEIGYDYYGEPEESELDIWNAFNDYQDPDGFYFLGHFSDCSESHEYAWTYYPPWTFKMLVYFPENNRFAVTDEIYERYAFDSYYTVNGTDAEETGLLPPLRKTYDLGGEAASFFARLVVTLAAEMALALAFGFWAKKQLKVIFAANLATQVILNLLLNFINFKYGFYLFVFNYIWMEGVVCLIEGGVYVKTLEKYAANPQRKVRPWLYAVTANLASIVLGLLVAQWLPGIL